MITTFFCFVACMVALVAGGHIVTRRLDDAPQTALMLKNNSIDVLTEGYNDLIYQLELEYESKVGGWVMPGYDRKKDYSNRYCELAREYNAKVREQKRQWAESHPLWAKARKVWGRIFLIGFLGGMGCCTFVILADDIEDAKEEMLSSFASYDQDDTETGPTFWNGQNIPIPYLQDASQYVSNPDSVLSQNVVDSMNVILKAVENDFDIQTVVAVVNYIEDDDPFRMAQDIGNSYGVGRRDRGLVIVVGYEDHSINISPGRALEADLTDAECYRMQQQYVVPAMRVAKPDSAMLYLTLALYAHLQKKEMPQMSPLLDDIYDEDDEDHELAIVMVLYLLYFIAWLMFFSRLNRKYNWVRQVGAVTLHSNPFYEQESSGGSGFFSGGGGGSSHGGGGSFGGGSFGGGSFGGGGATSRW